MPEQTNETTGQEFPVGLTERGQAVYAGQNALPGQDGTDGLTAHVQSAGGSGPATAEGTGETETPDPEVTTPPGPADLPGPPEMTPVTETADDPSAGDRETRSE